MDTSNFIISGIQQVGVGTNNVRQSWDWYRETFGMNIPIFHETAPAELMHPYTGGEIHNREAMLILNRHGGGGLEIWQFLSRRPLDVYEGLVPGDYGVFSTCIKCANLLPVFDNLFSRDYDLLHEPVSNPAGTSHFYLYDFSGNVFDIVQTNDWFVRSQTLGGVSGVMIGVSDMEQSLQFYRDFLGFQVVYDETGVFPDFVGLPAQRDRYHRVMLKYTGKKGPFHRFFGTNYVELVVALDRQSKPIYEGRVWGDPGFMHLCFDVIGMDALIEKARMMGFRVSIDSKDSFSMESSSGRFAYVEDPDGSPIEFVETHRMQVGKRMHIDLKKRKKQTALPNWMLKMLKHQQRHA